MIHKLRKPYLYSHRMSIQKSIQKWMVEHIHIMTYIPDELYEHISASTIADYMKDPWWLAEAIFKIALGEKEAEEVMVQLLQTVEASIQKDTLMDNICEIMENTIDIISTD